ncbi:MAG: kelch repeat-containing protein, partial [Thermoplasmata archaeon]
MKMRKRLGAVTLAPILALLMVGSSLAILAQPTSAEWTGGWTSELAMGETRAQAVVVGSPEGIVYVIGGVVDAATYYSVPNVCSYNMSSGSWTVLE